MHKVYKIALLENCDIYPFMKPTNLPFREEGRIHYSTNCTQIRAILPAVTSLDGDNGDWGRKMPKKRKILEDKKEDLDL